MVKKLIKTLIEHYLSGESQVDEEGNDEGAEGDGRLVLPQPRVLVHEARGDRLEGARHRREAGQHHQTECKFAMTESKVIPGKIYQQKGVLGKVGKWENSADSPEEQAGPEPVILEGGERRLCEGVADQPEAPARDGDEEERAVGILERERNL